MEQIYKNQVKSIGKEVDAFVESDFLIIFGDSAPEELKDYCYAVDVNPINGEIKAGDVLSFDDQEYTVTAIGDEAPVTLKGLGHCTIRFTGDTTPEMPGSMYVEKKPMPKIQVGTVIQIVRK